MYDPRKVDLTVVVVKAYVLGGIFCLSTMGLILLGTQCLASPWTPVLVYLQLLCGFHMLEFITTSRYNPTEVDSDLFLLEDYQMLAANALALVEYLVKVHWYGYTPKHSLVIVGLIMALVGQAFRTLAMYTAGTLFNHYIQRQRLDRHTLVTHGVYLWLRHPLYFGFWWWFVGLQIMLQNVFISISGGFVLWRFFRGRIEFEEGFLVDFFGDNYVDYARRTPVGIPGIVTRPQRQKQN